MTDNLDGKGTKLMILRIAQGLRRSDDDTLAGMDAQRVEVFHVANSDAVVVTVAHHLIFNFLPAFKALFNQHLRREREGFLGQSVELFFIVTEATAQSTQRISGTDDDRIAQFGSRLAGLLNILTGFALDGLDINFVQAFHKELTVFCIHDGLDRSAQHLDLIFLKYTTLIQFNTTVEGCLTTK